MKYEKVDWLCCDNCEDYTEHLAHFSTHERDSSSDHFICQRCGWEYWGIRGKYEPPSDI